MIITGFVLLVLLVILLVWYSWPRFSKKHRAQSNVGCYPPAWAGHPKGCKEVMSVSVTNNTFKDKDGTIMTPEGYYQFVVEGDSMQFCDIHDKDLIFVKKGFRITDLKTDGFPYILVLKNSDPSNDECPEYKIRRAWGISIFGDDRFEKDVRAILESKDFEVIKTLKGKDGSDAYRGDEQVIEDFLTERLPRYEAKYIKCDNPDILNRTVIISTTFDTDNRYIHFSIHPIASIVGIVKGAFTVDKKDDGKDKK